MMTITLPERFFYTESEQHYHSFARIEDERLTIYGNPNFENLMYALTYALKGKFCYYCGIRCRENILTLDHVIPRDLGGPTIPNNLVPACKHCNNEKTNIPLKDYLEYRELNTQKEKAIVLGRVMFEQERIRNSTGFYLPKSWYSDDFEISEIIVTILLDSLLESKKDTTIKSFYEKYHHFQKPILVDRNGFLLDGFKTVLFAKNAGIPKIPAIVLENVEKISKIFN